MSLYFSKREIHVKARRGKAKQRTATPGHLVATVIQWFLTESEGMCTKRIPLLIVRLQTQCLMFKNASVLKKDGSYANKDCWLFFPVWVRLLLALFVRLFFFLLPDASARSLIVSSPLYSTYTAAVGAAAQKHLFYSQG